MFIYITANEFVYTDESPTGEDNKMLQPIIGVFRIEDIVSISQVEKYSQGYMFSMEMKGSEGSRKLFSSPQKTQENAEKLQVGLVNTLNAASIFEKRVSNIADTKNIIVEYLVPVIGSNEFEKHHITTNEPFLSIKL